MFGESGALSKKTSPYETSTLLFTELDLATELGWCLEEYTKRMDWAQRRMKLYHRILKNEKENYQHEKFKKEQELEMQRQKNRPQVVHHDRPGIRHR